MINFNPACRLNKGNIVFQAHAPESGKVALTTAEYDKSRYPLYQGQVPSVFRQHSLHSKFQLPDREMKSTMVPCWNSTPDHRWCTSTQCLVRGKAKAAEVLAPNAITPAGYVPIMITRPWDKENSTYQELKPDLTPLDSANFPSLTGATNAIQSASPPMIRIQMIDRSTRIDLSKLHSTRFVK